MGSHYNDAAMGPEGRADASAAEKHLLANYPFHIYLMVMAARKALDEGRACIQDGVLVIERPEIQAAESCSPQKVP